MIGYLDISNYKSIKQLGLDCSRINVLIGEPNVGKSNILEALDLAYLPSMLLSNAINQKANKEQIGVKKYFRVNSASDLFNDGDISKPISIFHPNFSFSPKLSFERENNSPGNSTEKKSYFEISFENGFTSFDKDFNPLEPVQFFSSPIAPYRFKENIDFHVICHLKRLYALRRLYKKLDN